MALLPLLGWWITGLFDLDEGFYGAVVGEMNRRGEWITPFYNGSPWFEKPILLYWLAKPCMFLFGEMIGPRLPSVLCMLGTYALVGWFARRRFGDRVGQLSVLILASSLLIVALGRMMLTDAPLLLCISAAQLTFWESLVGDRRWRLVTAVAIGFGVLAKGPVAAILFLLIAGWTYWREPELRPRFRGQWLGGTLLLAVVVASWYVPAYLVNGKLFVDKFLIEQNIGRFTGGDAAHTVGLATLPAYIPVLFLGMIPWSIWIWGAWPRRSFKMDHKPDEALNRYLAVWAGVVFIFFTISGAKLVHYILPVFPPLAILVGRYLVERKWAVPTGYAMCGFMCVLANAGFFVWYGMSGQKEAHSLVRYLRQQPGDVALYELSRLEHNRGTGKLKLQETDLPSVLMYLNRDALNTGKLSDILAHNGPLWIFTRAGRIRPEDFVAAVNANRKLEQIMPTVKLDNFALYRLQ